MEQEISEGKHYHSHSSCVSLSCWYPRQAPGCCERQKDEILVGLLVETQMKELKTKLGYVEELDTVTYTEKEALKQLSCSLSPRTFTRINWNRLTTIGTVTSWPEPSASTQEDLGRPHLEQKGNLA